jgi:hypothetical protein
MNDFTKNRSTANRFKINRFKASRSTFNRFTWAVSFAGIALAQFGTAHAQQNAYSGMAAMHAAANGVPLSLVHRVIMRESRYNPRAVSKGNYGIMQIRLGTARGMGYTGSAAGLLDPNTNMTYAVKYLAGAYRAAGGNESRAVSLYASGYYSRANRSSQVRVARLDEANQNFGWFQPSYRTAYEGRARRQQQVATNFSLFQPAYNTESRRARRQQVALNYSAYDPTYSTETRRTRRQYAATRYTWVNPLVSTETRRTRYNRRAETTAWNPFAALFAPPVATRHVKRVRYARSSGWRNYN